MTREQIIKNWDLIVAIKEGKTIQCRINPQDTWYEYSKLDFNNKFEWRIKPEEPPEEPREFWLIPKIFKQKKAGKAVVYDYKVRTNPLRGAIHVKEIPNKDAKIQYVKYVKYYCYHCGAPVDEGEFYCSGACFDAETNDSWVDDI